MSVMRGTCCRPSLDQYPQLTRSWNNSPGWLARQQAKRSRRAWVCCCFWIGFGLFIVGVVAVVIWMLNSGILNNLAAGSNPNGGNMGEESH